MWKSAHRGQYDPTPDGVCRPGAGTRAKPLTGADGLGGGGGG